MRWMWPFMVIVCVLGGTGMTQGGQDRRQLVRVHIQGQSEEATAAFLRLGPDITSYGRDGRTVDVLMTVAGRDRVVALGFPIEVLIDDVARYEQALRSQDYFDHFHTYSRMVAELRQAAEDHPGIAALYDIGDSWEKTAQKANRDIWALKISDHVEMEERQEAEILYTACHHAREIITPEIVLFFMHYLIDGYGSDPEVTFLVDTRQIWLVPMVNPDGHAYVLEQDMWWRKNRRDNGDGTFGIDLNRNYGYMWGYDDVGSSPRPSSILYRGLAPFSEPETQAIRDLAESHTFVISLCYHSYGNLFLFPWGYAPENTPDHESFVTIGDSATIYNGYFSGNNKMGAIYATNGSSDDWLYGEQSTKHQILAYTPEVGNDEDGFHPDTSRIIPLIEENLWPNLYVARVAEQYAPRPVIHHLPPADTEDVTGPYLIRAEISSTAYPLDGTSPVVYFNTDGELAFDSLAMRAAGTPDVFEAWLPGQEEEVAIHYFISASDIVPRAGHAPATAPDSLYSFHVGPDTVSPVISHVARYRESIRNRPFRIEAEVRDNLGIADVELICCVNSQQPDVTHMAAAGSDRYTGTVDWEAPAVGDWIAYAIAARDRSARSNISRYPETGYLYLVLTDDLLFTFEDDSGGLATGPESDWEWGIPISGPEAAHSGEKVWATRLGGPYSDLSDSKLDMPPVDLAGFVSARLVFSHWYETEGYVDGGNIKISIDGGLFEVINPEDGYDGFILPTEGNPLVGEPTFSGQSGKGDFWHEAVCNLSPYIECSVVLRFHFGSNNTVRAPGWYIDDVELRLSASEVPQFCRLVLPGDTSDTTGPYVIMATILDDSDVKGAVISYRTSESDSFEILPMDKVVPYLFHGEIPGQPLGTRIEYYVKAEDDSGHVVMYPGGAPDSALHFAIVGTGIDDADASSSLLPDRCCLGQNCPNPFNAATGINFQIPMTTSQTHVSLSVYNILGQEIRTLVDEWKEPGQHMIIWDGKDESGQNMGSGIYFYRLQTRGMSQTKAMVLLR